jgi:hypothetical protein
VSRSHAEPAQVYRADELPGQFCWRGRLYSIRAVLAHWKDAGQWWPAVAGSGPAVPELEFWRVEAQRGRDFPAGIYDLCFEVGSGRWSVARTHD